MPHGVDSCVSSRGITTSTLRVLAATMALTLVSGAAFAAPMPQQLGTGDEPMLLLSESTVDVYEGVALPVGAAFTARRSDGDAYDLRIDLPGDKSIISRIDYDSRVAKIRVISNVDGNVTTLERADLESIEQLSLAIERSRTGAENGRTVEVFDRILNWLSGAPAGIRLDHTVELADRSSLVLETLCSKIGVKVVADYDTFISGVQRRTIKVGPCMRGECWGRCGAGCGGGVGWRMAIQQFTKDCLDHDYCVSVEGSADLTCDDEFVETFDDAADAPDCNAIKGEWTVSFKSNRADFSKDFTFTTTDPKTGNAKFNGKTSGSGRKSSFKGTRAVPQFKNTKIKIPLFMTGNCAGQSAGFATAKFTGIGKCGKMAGRLTKGSWTQFDSKECKLIDPLPWTGRVTATRTDMPAGRDNENQ